MSPPHLHNTTSQHPSIPAPKPVMAVEVFCGDPFPSFSGITRNMDTNALPSFHHEAFPTPITTPARSLRRFSSKKTRESAHKVEKTYRSDSSPPLRTRASTMSDSEQDKKRNKLGYQRISIACGEYLITPPCSRYVERLTDGVQLIAAVAKFDAFSPRRMRKADARIVFA